MFPANKGGLKSWLGNLHNVWNRIGSGIPSIKGKAQSYGLFNGGWAYVKIYSSFWILYIFLDIKVLST